MVVPQIGVILVCSWEEVSSGSFYSAILASLPFTIFFAYSTEALIRIPEKTQWWASWLLLRGRGYAERCTQHSARHGEQEGKVFGLVLISSCKGLTLASPNTWGCSRTETRTCPWEILTCIHLMIASFFKKISPACLLLFQFWVGLWKFQGCSWRIEKSSQLGGWVCVCVRAMLSHGCCFATPWTVPCQAPLSMWFSRQ